MKNLPGEPLDTEERALVAQLPRLRGRGEPTPELDARILAAARAAQTGAGSSPPRHRRRWQMPLALAASLCLAVGLAWQLRLAPTRHAQMEAARPVAAEPAATVAAESAAATAPPAPADIFPMAAPRQETSAVPAPPRAPAAAHSPQVAVEAAAPAPTSASAAAQEAPTPPALAADRPSPAPIPPPPAAAPAPAALPPPTPAAAISAFPADDTAETARSERRSTEGAGRQRTTAAEALPASKSLATPPATPPPAPATAARPAAAAPPPPAATRAETPRTDRMSSAAARTHADNDAAEDDLPPATMNSPAAREAWLQRIAELAHAGRLDEARASLAEFRKRYPNEPIPPILHKLEQGAQR